MQMYEINYDSDSDRMNYDFEFYSCLVSKRSNWYN